MTAATTRQDKDKRITRSRTAPVRKQSNRRAYLLYRSDTTCRQTFDELVRLWFPRVPRSRLTYLYNSRSRVTQR